MTAPEKMKFLAALAALVLSPLAGAQPTLPAGSSLPAHSSLSAPASRDTSPRGGGGAPAATSPPPTGPGLVHHDIVAHLDPKAGTIAASDRLTLPPGTTDWTLTLHAGLAPKVAAGEATLASLGQDRHLERYRLRLTGPGPVTLSYSGTIRHDMEDVLESLGRAHQRTRGTIVEDGVFLDGSSGWYPRPGDGLHTFSLTVTVPQGWLAVSQGAGPDAPADPAAVNGGSTNEVRVSWREDQPQDDIYLVAAPFTLYRRANPMAEAQVYLRRPGPALAARDGGHAGGACPESLLHSGHVPRPCGPGAVAGLAERYLDATESYLDLYAKLLGPYPYAKFALVENFWESGYGMPSFTLLGPQVIRLPFIVETSYPHEILHNWWGNGVYVDYASGNWSEGLTAYLADHLLAERRDGGADYRRNALKDYADYVRGDKDFPLREFRSRHSSASQAVGYGKAMMFFHMLRRQLGDRTFVQGLRRFYADNRFRVADYDDLRQAFEETGRRDLGPLFAAWTERTGAPRIKLSDVVVRDDPPGFHLTGRIDQTQVEAPYPMDVPILIDLIGGRQQEETVHLDQRSTRFDVDLPVLPLRVSADPDFDLFRTLAEGEAPVTLSRLFGAERGAILWPAGAPAELAEGYRSLAKAWAADHPGWEVRSDRDLVRLPQGLPVWVLGWENDHLGAFAAGETRFRLDPAQHGLHIGGAESLPVGRPSPVLTRTIDGQPIAWLATPDATPLPGLARKLPHYGKYSYLVFSGDAPEVRIKGQWPPGDSELTAWLTHERPEPKRRERPPLADQAKSGGEQSHNRQ